MFVSQRKYERALMDATAAHDRLDQVLAENEKLMALLKTALQLKRPKAKEVIPVSPSEKPEPMPAIIQRAIETTFPGDQQIYAANMTYAHSQAHRWEAEAEEVASEIRIGRQ